MSTQTPRALPGTLTARAFALVLARECARPPCPRVPGRRGRSTGFVGNDTSGNRLRSLARFESVPGQPRQLPAVTVAAPGPNLPRHLTRSRIFSDLGEKRYSRHWGPRSGLAPWALGEAGRVTSPLRAFVPSAVRWRRAGLRRVLFTPRLRPNHFRCHFGAGLSAPNPCVPRGTRTGWCSLPPGPVSRM